LNDTEVGNEGRGKGIAREKARRIKKLCEKEGKKEGDDIPGKKKKKIGISLKKIPRRRVRPRFQGLSLGRGWGERERCGTK